MEPRQGEAAYHSGGVFQDGGEVSGAPVGFSWEEMGMAKGAPMNPKDGPGLVDVLFSPVIAMVVMVIAIMGYFLLAPWGREN